MVSVNEGGGVGIGALMFVTRTSLGEDGSHVVLCQEVDQASVRVKQLFDAALED